MRKQKLVFVINNFLIGGVEHLLFDIITRLDREKLEVSLITVFGSGPLENSFRQHQVPIYFAGPYRNTARPLPFKLYWLVVAPITTLRLLLLMAKIKPDIVVTSLYQADFLGMMAARLAGIRKRIIIQHDVQAFNKLRTFFKRIALDLATHVVANSQTVQQFLMCYFQVPSGKITVIPNGVDLRLFSRGIKLSDGAGGLTLGMIGRLEPVKGPIYLLKALKILKEEFQLEPRTVFFGDGSLRLELENYAEKHHLKHVQFAGFVLDVPTALKQIDILVVPSLAEGFGLVVLEGLAAHKVLVASDLPAIRELITPPNGLLFPPGDVRALASYLVRVLTNRSLFLKLKKYTACWLNQQAKPLDIKRVTHQYKQLFLS